MCLFWKGDSDTHTVLQLYGNRNTEPVSIRPTFDFQCFSFQDTKDIQSTRTDHLLCCELCHITYCSTGYSITLTEYTSCKNMSFRDFLHPSLEGVSVQSMIRELRSQKPWDEVKEEKSMFFNV